MNNSNHSAETIFKINFCRIPSSLPSLRSAANMLLIYKNYFTKGEFKYFIWVLLNVLRLSESV